MPKVKVSLDAYGKAVVLGSSGTISRILISGHNQFAKNDFVAALNRSKDLGNIKNSDILDSIKQVCNTGE